VRDTDFYHHFDNKSSDSATAGIGGGALGDPEVWWEAGPGFSVIARSGLLPLLFRLINADEVHFLERVGPIDIRLLDTAQPFGSGGSHFGADQHPMLTRFPSSAPCNRIPTTGALMENTADWKKSHSRFYARTLKSAM